jgi:hypothetical protein
MDDTKSHVFVVLYAGRTIGQARIVAASADHDLVELAVRRMLPDQHEVCGAQNSINTALGQSPKCAHHLISNRGRTD